MSDNIIEQIQSKQELIEKIQKWVTLDSQLKIVSEKTKQMREMWGYAAPRPRYATWWAGAERSGCGW